MELLKMIFRKTFYNLRNIFFKNRIGEIISIYFQKLFGLKLIVPHLEYDLHTFRLVKRNGLFLKLDISNEVDHFIYFKKRDSSFDYLHNEIKNARTILDIGGNIGAFALFLNS
ncbi:MAG: hypothetical protein IPL56_00705 [Saprospiraceae bacterium]|nr:hypothetical protein [Saprospiraceae bacterium]